MELSQIPAALQSRLRLSVIAALLSGSKKFRTLQDLTGATAGNLGKQLDVYKRQTWTTPAARSCTVWRGRALWSAWTVAVQRASNRAIHAGERS